MTATPIVLAAGGHEDEFNGDFNTCKKCLFEAYNWLTRETFDAQCPPGVSPVLHAMGMRLNDCLPHDTRQALTRYLPNGTDPLDGTAGDGRDETRSYMALDWLIRTHLLRFLELSPRLAEHAAAVRELAPIRTMAAAEAAGPVMRAVRAAAWAAAGAAAGNAAWDAAWTAAGAAAWAAAGAAARDAAWAAAWAAAGAAAWDAARAAARAADWAAARAVLNPVVVVLQESALALFDQMIKGIWGDDSE